MPVQRQIKNIVKNYSDVQCKVREATSNDPWGPSSTLMSEIADLTYNHLAFTEIMQMIWKRLNDHGKNWRHVYKSLAVLEYVMKVGNEKVAQQCRENIFSIQTLKDFQYVEDGKDQGLNVREKAKQLVALLQDDERLQNERAKAIKTKERLSNNPVAISASGGQVVAKPPNPNALRSPPVTQVFREVPHQRPAQRQLSTELEAARPSNQSEEALQIQLALAMSKEEHEDQVKRQKQEQNKLKLAVEESVKDSPEKPTTQATLLDLSASFNSANPPTTNTTTSSDPWVASTSSPMSNEQSVTSDPWATVGDATATADPWSPEPEVKSNGAAISDPWSSEPSSDPWGTKSQQTTKSTAEDDFDLGNRLAISTTTNQSGSSHQQMKNNNNPNATDPSFHSFGDVKNDTVVTNATNDNDIIINNNNNDNDRKPKDPKQFLGEHVGLVNLENLVTKPTGGSSNPFAGPSGGGLSQPTSRQPTTLNPFQEMQQQSHAATRIPLNQLQAQSSAGFATPVSAEPAGLPAPLIPPGTTVTQQFTLAPNTIMRQQPPTLYSTNNIVTSNPASMQYQQPWGMTSTLSATPQQMDQPLSANNPFL